jgi:hypothetical protein
MAAAVAEDERRVGTPRLGGAVGGDHVGADDEHAAVRPEADEVIRHREAVDEAAALVADVERRDADQAELRGQHRGHAARRAFRRLRRDDHAIDLVDAAASGRERLLGGGDGHVGGRLMPRGMAAHDRSRVVAEPSEGAGGRPRACGQRLRDVAAGPHDARQHAQVRARAPGLARLMIYGSPSSKLHARSPRPFRLRPSDGHP